MKPTHSTLQDYIINMTKAISHAMGGGSENFFRLGDDLFVLDYKHVALAIRERQHHTMSLVKKYIMQRNIYKEALESIQRGAPPHQTASRALAKAKELHHGPDASRSEKDSNS